MRWWRAVAQILVCLVALGAIVFGLSWSVWLASDTLGLLSAWLFPGGVAHLHTVPITGFLYVFGMIVISLCAIIWPIWLVLGLLDGFCCRMGWVQPQGQHRKDGF